MQIIEQSAQIWRVDMNRKILVPMVAALAMMSVSALAVEVSNDDQQKHMLGLNMDSGQTEMSMIELLPGTMVEGICESGCTMRLESGNEIEVKGSEKVVIQEGELIIDEE